MPPSQDYPRMMFHRTKPPVTVHSREEEAELGSGWSRTIWPPKPEPKEEPPEPEPEEEEPAEEPEEERGNEDSAFEPEPKHHAKKQRPKKKR